MNLRTGNLVNKDIDKEFREFNENKKKSWEQFTVFFNIDKNIVHYYDEAYEYLDELKLLKEALEKKVFKTELSWYEFEDF